MKKIITTNGHVAFVDNEDYVKFGHYRWNALVIPGSGKVYISRYLDGKITYLHREILQAHGSFVVDHINGNPLDNRRKNIRICSRQQNTWNSKLNRKNTSGYKGVSLHKPSGKWVAKIKVNMKRIHLGLHKEKLDAARAYDNAAKLYFGDFAVTNF